MATPQFAFTKATKKKSKLRAALYGPSGGGKTFTALRIATGVAQQTGGRVAVIDSEFGSASKYSDRFDFDCLDLAVKTIATYSAAIEAAGKAGYSAIVIDSLSHAWWELLDDVDRLAKAKYGNNTHAAWSEGTPKQRQLIESILKSPSHIIATMRAETEWAQEQGANGKTKPVKVGLKPIQGKGIEFEFDMLLSINADHIATVEKDRTGKFQDKIITKPGEDFGVELAQWLNEGVVPVEPPERAVSLGVRVGAVPENPNGNADGNGHQPARANEPGASAAKSSPATASPAQQKTTANPPPARATVNQQDRIRELANMLNIRGREFDKLIKPRTGGKKDLSELPEIEAKAVIAALEVEWERRKASVKNADPTQPTAGSRIGPEVFEQPSEDEPPFDVPGEAARASHPNDTPANGRAGFATVDQCAAILQLRDALHIQPDTFRESIVKRTGDPERCHSTDLTAEQAASIIVALQGRLEKKLQPS